MIDLSLFALILIIFEMVLIKASTGWFPNEPWTVSVTAAITAIVMVRWGPWAVIHAVAGGIVFCAVNRGQAQQFLIYCIGNTAALAVLPLVRKVGWEKLRESFLLKLLWSILTVLAMQAGRVLTAMILGASPASAAGFITTDVVTYIFTAAILWIMSRLDGMLEDQRHYLARVHDPANREGGIA
jgi:hypothetical protein